MHTSDGSMSCVRLSDGVRNKLSSFTYGPISLGKTIGSWETVFTYNAPFERKIEVGVTKTDSSASETSAAKSFAASMEIGVGFMGMSSTRSLSFSYDKSFKETVTETASKTEKETYTYTCGSE